MSSHGEKHLDSMSVGEVDQDKLGCSKLCGQLKLAKNFHVFFLDFGPPIPVFSN